jgi:DMSO/TMAO reductase YedYZ molybdopterin-dependent catalytic subunit
MTSRRELLRQLGGVLLLGACAGPRGSSPAAPDIAANTDSAAADLGPTPDVQAAVDSSTADAAPWLHPMPAVTANADHYITSCCATPKTDPANWTLKLLDEGQLLGTLDLAFLDGLAASTREHTFQCISSGPDNLSISNAIWTGLPVSDILAAKGIAVPKERPSIRFAGADEYSTGLPIEDLQKPVWLVWRMNGQPLPPDHGFPVRALVPGRYGMKSCKWLQEIEFRKAPYLGTWESTGWSDEAVVKPNALIWYPEAQQPIPAGKPFRFAGTAFAGSDPVTGVSIRFDGGEWQSAVLDYAPGADRWTLWHLDLQLAPGPHVMMVRCVTASGATSIDGANPKDELSGWGYGGSMELAFTVV